MGNTCKPMAVSFQCMTKSTTKKKKKANLMTLQTLSKTLQIFNSETFKYNDNKISSGVTIEMKIK